MKARALSNEKFVDKLVLLSKAIKALYSEEKNFEEVVKSLFQLDFISSTHSCRKVKCKEWRERSVLDIPLSKDEHVTIVKRLIFEDFIKLYAKEEFSDTLRNRVTVAYLSCYHDFFWNTEKIGPTLLDRCCAALLKAVNDEHFKYHEYISELVDGCNDKDVG